MQNHSVIHDGERVYVCEVCTFSSRRIENLKVHMRTHLARKPFQCGICHKQYTQKAALEQHLSVHIERRYCCDICRQQFTSLQHMNAHMLRAHVPDELREEVTRSGSVTVHMCEECHSVFISQDLLAVHILEEHMQQTHAQPKVSSRQ